MTNKPPYQVLAYNTPTTQKNYFRDTSFFIQDTWNIKRRLTLNLGLRYDNFRTYYPVQKSDPNETFSQLFPITTYAASGNLVDWNNVSPRIGVAYDPTGKGTSVIRFGYGIYYIMQGTGLAETANPVGLSGKYYAWTRHERPRRHSPNRANGCRRALQPYPWVRLVAPVPTSIPI